MYDHVESVVIPSQKIKEFHSKIFKWWNHNKRSFPWRETTNPYYILVSEIMLQQTQASRVVPKYESFIRLFPEVKDLAHASTSTLLQAWSGLGYNKRALWLREVARQIVKGGFPKSPIELQKMKGIGRYTANSVFIFAFNQDLVTVDTNIKKVLVHEGFVLSGAPEKLFWQVSEYLLPKGKSRDWHNALMDYAAIELSTFKVRKPGSTSSSQKFKGSRREKRGKILKELLRSSPSPISQLQKTLQVSKEELISILRQLEEEGFLQVNVSQQMVYLQEEKSVN